jgi:hypothetical protein
MKAENKKIPTIIPETDLPLSHSVMANYDLPDSYFEQFSTNLLQQIQLEAYLDTLPKNMPHHLPSTYFQEFEPIPLPETINPFYLPDFYFEELTLQLNKKIAGQLHVKINPLRHSTKYVVSMAAAILLFVSSAWFLLQNKITPLNNTPVHQISELSANEIDTYLNQHQTEFLLDEDTETLDYKQFELACLDIDCLIDNIDQTELNNYLL